MIAVTGCSGWVGNAVVERLKSLGTPCVADRTPDGKRSLDLRDPASIGRFLDEAREARVQTVIHCAARVHQMRDTMADSLAAYLAVNAEGTRLLASAAQQRGIRRFVFVSTIKVNGDATQGRPFSGEDRACPGDAYAQSKFAAEQFLLQLAANGGFEPVIVRPPILYGAGVKANFRALVRAVLKRYPLPFGCITENRRTFASVRNFADALAQAAGAPSAAFVGRSFTFSDHPAVSTRTLIEEVAAVAGLTPRLLPVPIWALHAVGRITGRTVAMKRLVESLEVDGGILAAALQWSAPFSRSEELSATVAEVMKNG